MEPSTEIPPSEASAWRRRRSRFYLWLLVALMALIAVAGWLGLRRLRP